MAKREFDDEIDYGKPSRKFDKKKQQPKRGKTTEDKSYRQVRVGFKNYLQELKEKEIEDLMDDDFDEE